jgi:hypothetical protein
VAVVHVIPLADPNRDGPDAARMLVALAGGRALIPKNAFAWSILAGFALPPHSTALAG